MTLTTWILLTIIFVMLGVFGLMINAAAYFFGGIMNSLSRGAFNYKKLRGYL